MTNARKTAKPRRPNRERFEDVMQAYVSAGVAVDRVCYDRQNDVVFILPENQPYMPTHDKEDWTAYGRGL